jgi:hypothetical protein
MEVNSKGGTQRAIRFGMIGLEDFLLLAMKHRR